jgi:succinate dehydrogenase / fumarate reductase cytochrome b subunit
MAERPLSPHLSIYKPQLTSMMSIFHRMTGASLAAGSLLVVWWTVALAVGPEYYAFVQNILTSVLGQAVLFGFTVAVSYHLSNGIRHLLWDFGYNLSIEGVYRSGYTVLILTIILTAVTWSFVLMN